MSQIFNPGGSTAVAEHEPEPVPVEAGTSGSRTKMYIAGAVVLALLLAAASYFLFFSGGSSDTGATGAVVTPTAVAHPSTHPSAKAPAPAASSVPVAAATASARDPFVPLVVPSTSAVATTSGSAVPSAGATATGAPSAGSTTGIPSTGTPKLLMVTAVNHGKNTVTSNVDGKLFTAGLGATFDTYFQVIGIQGGANCAILRYGDVTLNACQGVPFTLTG
jgi:hypothetical protein